MAFTIDQAREMRDRADAAGVKNMVFFTYRWLPTYRKIRRLIDEGYLGRCYHCSIRYISGYARTVDYQWRFDANRCLGALGDLGSHAIDLARWLVGDISKVSAQLSSHVERRDSRGIPVRAANDFANLALQFDNGAQGSLQISTVAHVGDRGHEQHLLLYGENGSLEAYGTLGSEMWIRGLRHTEESSQPIAIDDDLREGADTSENVFAQAMQMFCTQSIGTRLFADAVLTDRAVTPSFHDGFMAQVVMDAAFQSAEEASAFIDVVGR
jgi:predicted dehydrogenase